MPLHKYPCMDCQPPQRYPGCRKDCPNGPAAERFEQERREIRELARQERIRGREADFFKREQVSRTKRDLNLL